MDCKNELAEEEVCIRGVPAAGFNDDRLCIMRLEFAADNVRIIAPSVGPSTIIKRKNE
jgi:hypothetical protein